MAIDVTAEIAIAAPRERVAAFIEDPANDLKWIRALSEARQLTEGEFGIGTRVERVARTMGRNVAYTTEVESFEPGRHVGMKTVSGPFPMIVDYDLEDAGEGLTRVRVRNRGGKGAPFSLFGPLIGRMVNSRVRGDLAQLKRVLEMAD